MGGQAGPGHSQQGACAPADPSILSGGSTEFGVGWVPVPPATCPPHAYVTSPSTLQPTLYPPRRILHIHFKRSPWYPSPSFVSHRGLGLEECDAMVVDISSGRAGTGSSGRHVQRQPQDVGCRACPARLRAPGTIYACLSARVSPGHTSAQVGGPRLARASPLVGSAPPAEPPDGVASFRRSQGGACG